MHALPTETVPAERTGSRTDATGESAPGAVDFASALARMLAVNSSADARMRIEDASMEGPQPAIETGLDELAPEFRARLERVIARMEQLGHSVQVVETYREQSRQDWLFEQGRTRPGPIVTWTRDSNHTQGRAADLVIDGRYDGPGYQTLQKIAEQEGLRTLGPRDPGHVELPAETVGKATMQPRSRVFVAPVAEVAQIAEPARVARVAEVASSAQVAEPARVALAGVVGGRAAAGKGEGRSTRQEAGESAASSDALDAAAGPHRAFRDPASAAALFANGADTPASASISSSAPLDRVSDADLASRIARVLEIQDAGARQPLSSVVLRLTGLDTTAEMIRVARRGQDVSTSIETADPARALDLQGHIHELRAALETHGLRSELNVQVVRAADASGQNASGQSRQHPRRNHERKEER